MGNFNKFVMFFNWSNGTCLLLVKIGNECEMYCSTEVISDTLSLLWIGWILGIYSNSKSSVSLKLFTRSIVDEFKVVSIPLQLPLWYIILIRRRLSLRHLYSTGNLFVVRLCIHLLIMAWYCELLVVDHIL